MSMRDKAQQILDGLGGGDNIRTMEPCITRIRVELVDRGKLDEALLKQAGAHGVMKMGGAVQVVMGPQSDNIEAEMRRIMGEGWVIVASPLGGRVLALEQVDDPVFADRVMGDGAAVVPDDGTVLAPVGGTVAKLFPGGHGLVIETDAGVAVLVHLGIDTVELKGDGFAVVAAEGDTVAAGDPLVRMDLSRLRALGVDLTSPVVVISGHSARCVAEGEVLAGAPLLEVASAPA